MRRGFSLIETLVAVIILGVALVGLTQGITAALATSKETELQTAAALLAAGRIETLRAEGHLMAGETEGEGDSELSGYRWSQRVSTGELEGLYEVTVVVSHATAGENLYELKTLLFEAPLKPEDRAYQRKRTQL